MHICYATEGEYERVPLQHDLVLMQRIVRLQCSLIPSRCAQAECEPEHGRADQGRRRFPLLVKDVAGLVPGAYGRPCFTFRGESESLHY